MITITALCDDNGRTSEFKATGHAGYSNPGRDIVCAAVSALTQSAALFLQTYAGATITDDGQSFRVTVAETSKETEAVLQCMIGGLQEIERQYPRSLKVNH